MGTIYCDYVSCLEDIERLLKDSKFGFIKHSFVFGSLSRKLIHDDSDIDLLLIGDLPKDINLVTMVSKSIDDCLRVYKDIDIKYYEIENFRSLRDTNLFLKTIENDCVRVGDLKNELLRLCS